jgi:uncharacterized OB-fold protein
VPDAGYFPDGMPLPLPDAATAAFWEGCGARELRIQRCAACGAHRHPPAPICPRCRSFVSTWDVSRGAGHVFSYTVVHHPVHPATEERVPYNVAVVELDDCGGVLVTSNVVNTDDEVFVGMPVQLVWEQVDESLWLYRFTP